jgi:hypothetical protein
MTYPQFLATLRETPRTWWQLCDPYFAACPGQNLIRCVIADCEPACPLDVVDPAWRDRPMNAEPDWAGVVRNASDGLTWETAPRDGWPEVAPSRLPEVRRVRRDLLAACGLPEDA